MDVGRVFLLLAKVYTVTLVVVGTLTLVWVLNPTVGESPEVAGLWFAVGGFGLLVVLTIVLIQLSR